MQSDCISREAAIENAISQMRASKSELCMRERLMNLPAADVRPLVRGKWISEDDEKTIVRMKYGEPQGSCKCSVCGEWLVASDEYGVKGNFCPNCGADMREES